MNELVTLITRGADVTCIILFDMLKLKSAPKRSTTPTHVFSTSSDKLIKMWQITNSYNLSPLKTFAGHSNTVFSALIFPPRSLQDYDYHVAIKC